MDKIDTSGNLQKKTRLAIRKNIYRLRRKIAGYMAAAVISVSPFNAAGQENYAGKNNDSRPENQKNMLAYGRMVEIDISGEISRRADWVVDQFLDATKKHLQKIRQAKSKGSKTRYVKNNFFDMVYPTGRLSGSNNYCITAINRALMDANTCGDLNSALPNYATEGGQAVECRRFVAYLEKRGFRDCISYGPISSSRLKPGDIVMTPRGGGRYHAVTYIGNGMVRSFNNDGEWPLKRKNTGIVISTRKIAEKSIRRQLEKDRLIDPQKGDKQIISLPNAQKLLQVLYSGRNGGDTRLAQLTGNEGEPQTGMLHLYDWLRQNDGGQRC